jgi:hypothetical protein
LRGGQAKAFSALLILFSAVSASKARADDLSGSQPPLR